MPPNSPDRLSKIEDLKSKLFSKNYKTRTQHHDSFIRPEMRDVTNSWGDRQDGINPGEKFFMQTSLFKKFFIFSSVFFGLAVLYAAYMFFVGGNVVSNENITIDVLGNTYTAGGEELPLQISITNKNHSALELVDLVLEYPRNSDGTTGEVERNRISLGTIPAGAVRDENVKVILFGEQGSIRPIRMILEYRVEGSNAIFVKERSYEVNINSTPLDLTVTGPATVSPNQEVSLKIKTALNSTKSIPKVIVKVDYPVGFQFVSSTPGSSLSNNIWTLGDLAPGAQSEITVVGRMVDVFDGEEKTFRVYAGSQSTKDKSVIDVVFNSLGHTVTVQRPSLEASLYINGQYQREYTVNSKGTISGEIRWTNNMDTRINDLVIKAKISGNAVDERTISSTQGFYESSTDTITWDKNSQSRFVSVNPGDGGAVTFSMSPASLYSPSGLINSPTIRVDVSISGKQSVEGYEVKDLNNTESKIIKIASEVGLTTKALHYSGPFQNTGPVPPKAEAETTYTVVWTLSNTANNVSKGAVKATLPVWMRFVGTVSPVSADVVYNSTTREITWNAGNIPKGTGISGATKEVAFKIVIKPSLSQVGTAPVIINEAVLTGHDDFANLDVRVSRPPLYTRLTSDPAFPPTGDRVVE